MLVTAQESHPDDEAAYRGLVTFVPLHGLRAAIELMLDGEPGRTGRILALLSDTTDQPIDVAPGKGASGAWDGFRPDEANHGGRG